MGLRDSVLGASKSITSRFKNIRSTVGEFFQKFKNLFKSYDLYKEIKNHPWNKSFGLISAKRWYNDYKKDKNNWLQGQLMRQGHLYMFDYKEPKYKDTPQLPWFDENPLVLSLGPIKTSLGWRTININLHLLPPITRRIVLSRIFEFNKNRYKGLMGLKNQKVVMVKYKDIIEPLEKYGVAFAIRMYIPELQKNIIEFKIEDWKNAIFLESKKLNGITIKGLQKDWSEFVKERKKNGSINLNSNWMKS